MSRINSLINEWKRELHRFQHLEDGTIEELEDHLREEIATLVEQGKPEEEAFDIARKQIGSIADVDRDENRVLNEGSRLGFTAALIRNFVKVGGRHFTRNSLTSSINMVGLIAAFTAATFIGLYVFDELSFERHHPDWETIYRLSYSFEEENGEVEDRAYASGMWSPIVADRSPAVSEQFRFLNISYGYLYNPETDRSFYEEGIYWSDPNFFDFLNFGLKYGSIEGQLTDLSSIIMTESTAMKVFGEENPVGKDLKFMRRGNEINLVVTGVIYDPPSNSQFQPDYIAHIQAVQGIYGENYRGWVDQNPNPGYVFCHLKIPNPADVKMVGDELKRFWEEAIPDRAPFIKPLITPLGSIHFNPPIKWEMDTPVDVSYLYGMSLVGLFILVIALTNFVNLTTAQGSKRSKEIGLRKTLGSSVRQLRLQFFLESTWSVFIALLIAFAVVFLLLPQFNILVDKNIDLWRSIAAPQFAVPAILCVGLIIILTGLLPALYFTRKTHTSIGLGGYFKKEKINSPARNGMVILQFTVAITLIICTVVVFNQLQLINSGSLAKSRDAVIGVRTSRMGDSLQAQRYKEIIKSIPGVMANTLGMHLPRQTDFGRINTKYFARTISDEPYYWNKFDADGGFLSTYQLELLAGRDFRKNIEPGSLIVNRSLVEQLGLKPEEAIDHYLSEDSINYVFASSHGKIVGVVEDFAYKSIKDEIEPLVICANNYVEGVLSVKLDAANRRETISRLANSWNEVYPGRPFEFWYLDKEFDRMYNQERRLGKLIPIFSMLSIIIAFLGLFALTVFVAELRRKEIGIRKVLGCSSFSILKLLSWEYLRTLIPAIIIGVPLSYFGMSYWLDNFIYRVDISIWVILMAIASIVAFAMLTVSFKSISAANGNPVDSLKYE